MALGQYFGNAPKVPPTQFPPYARYLASQEAERQRQAAARVTGATTPTQLPAPRPAPTVLPGQVQQLPDTGPVLGPDELLPPVSPLELRPFEEEASVIQRPPEVRAKPTRQYTYQRGRFAETVTTGPS